ncbi:MAG: hypothetical protein QOG54_1694 [Actinomycetota bacterium]|jgi:hypothetical protein|nr:hypothetical protein [Actinomycetota bacterium]
MTRFVPCDLGKRDLVRSTGSASSDILMRRPASSFRRAPEGALCVDGPKSQSVESIGVVARG